MRDIILDILNIDILPNLDISPISINTFKRTLQEQGLQRYIRRAVSDELIDRIRYYFFKYGYNNKSILRDYTRNGFELTPYSLKLIHQENRIKRRYILVEERNEALARVIVFLKEDLQRTIVIKGFRRGYLYHYIQMKGNILVS